MSSQNYYGPPVHWITTENRIHRPAELIPLPTVLKRSEMEVHWHLKMPLPPVTGQMTFFPMNESVRMDIVSGRTQPDRRAHGVALILAKSGHGLRDAEMQILERIPGLQRLTEFRMACHLPGYRGAISQDGPTPVNVAHEDGRLYNLGELVMVFATMYKRFLRTGVSSPDHGTVQRTNHTSFQFDHIRLVALHFGIGRSAGWIFPEIILVDRDAP